ncbi:PLP-dependent aminotransferase family protein [Peribacillus sp. B-H-3]|uniref:MocR-like pyridoxine biosynthesis transcription factor PdxR n=1 Tax=Peribacillus sp. B-H-3 TaxID=3400420 RepID=UPI003B012D98
MTEIIYDFSHGGVDAGSFPYTVWRRISSELLVRDQSRLLFSGEYQGELSLRKELSRYLYHSRGVRCTPGQIIVGAGTQYLMMLLNLLIDKNAKIGVEDPGFHRTRAAFEHGGKMLIPLPLDEHGLKVNELKKTNANLVYVTPSHQFPYGMMMPLKRRKELLEWAQMQDGYIIEDDYDGEFRYSGKPIPSLQGLDADGRVIYLGTFSKSLIPSLRVSFMVLPQNLIEKNRGKLSVYKQTVSRFHQLTLYRFMKNGCFENHIHRIRTIYRKKHEVLLSSVRTHLGNRAEITGEKSGLHILLRIKDPRTEDFFINRALDYGVRVYPASIYYINQRGAYPEVLLGFGGLAECEIEEAIKRLADAWFSKKGGGSSSQSKRLRV